jgi:hypothetical protein
MPQYPDLPPAAGAEEVNQQAAEELRKAAAANGGLGVGDALDGIAEVGGAVLDEGAGEMAVAAVEVGGEVVGGAMEALGSGLELAGGCAEGCSLMVALVILLATAGTALALGWF